MDKNNLSKEDVQFINETGKQINQILSCGATITMSWGIDKLQCLLFRGMAAVIFKVNGFLFSGVVLIAYNEGSDLYEAYFFDKKKKIVKTIRDIYFDELVDVLDKEIETKDDQSDEYRKKVDDFYGF